MISDNVVRLRGLPYDATKEDVAKFFGDDFDIVEDGILLPLAKDGRASGQAYVQFTNGEDAKKALSKNREHMGHRYVEIFESSMHDAFLNQNGEDEPPTRSKSRNRSLDSMRGRPGPYDRGLTYSSYGRGFGPNGPGSMKKFGGRNDCYDEFGDYMGMRGTMVPSMGMGISPGMGMGGGFSPMNMGGMPISMGANAGFQMGHLVRMKGIPYNVTESDIAEWFSSVVDPIKVDISYSDDGRPSGNANVLFATAQDAKKAMTKDKENMQHRYIELFYEGDMSGMSPAGLGMSGGMGAAMGSSTCLGMSGSLGPAMGSPTGIGMSGSMGTAMGSPAALGMSGTFATGMGRGMGMGFGRGFGRGGMGMGFGGMPSLGSY